MCHKPKKTVFWLSSKPTLTAVVAFHARIISCVSSCFCSVSREDISFFLLAGEVKPQKTPDHPCFKHETRKERINNDYMFLRHFVLSSVPSFKTRAIKTNIRYQPARGPLLFAPWTKRASWLTDSLLWSGFRPHLAPRKKKKQRDAHTNTVTERAPHELTIYSAGPHHTAVCICSRNTGKLISSESGLYCCREGSIFAPQTSTKTSPVKDDFFVKQPAVPSPEARAQVTAVGVVHDDAQHIPRRAVGEALPKAHDIGVRQLRQQGGFFAGL